MSAEIIFGLIAMLGFGLSSALSKIPAKNIKSKKLVFFRNLISSSLFIILMLLFNFEMAFSMKYILIAFLISFIGYIPLVVFYKALDVGKVGVVVPVANSSVLFTVLFSILFFGESLSMSQAFSILLIITGIFFISLNFHDLKKSNLFQLSSGIPYALITSFLWGLIFVLFKIPIMIIGPILTAFIIELGGFLSSAMHMKISKTSFSAPTKKNLLYIFFVAFFGVIGALFFNMGIKCGNISIVAALMAANPLVSTLYARIAYKEKISITQGFSILLIITGIISISYF
ncbi:MAG: DMT family transporter [Candidatus Aenigmarchaeota archaeon]|nr:DMT family transporter [Candidatus Aenigmarchaeota archaeon]